MNQSSWSWDGDGMGDRNLRPRVAMKAIDRRSYDFLLPMRDGQLACLCISGCAA